MQGQELNLNVRQKQALAITPRLLQSISVLGMARDELESFIEAELENNPMLEKNWDDEKTVRGGISGEPGFEREKQLSDEQAAADLAGEDFDWAEYLKGKGENDSFYKYGYGSPADMLPDTIGSEQKLIDYLLEQLTKDDLKRISTNDIRAYEIAACIAESLDGNGFLPRSDTDMLIQSGFPEEEVLAAVEVFKGLEPAGIAAADLRESLVLQYRRSGGRDPLVIEIIQGYLSDLAIHNVASVSKALGRKRNEVERCFETIAALDPKPGRGFQGGEETQYIIPDLIIDKTENGYEARVGETFVPALTINPYYRKILMETKKGSEEHTFLAERLNAAATLIKNLETREQTVYRVMAAILKHQQKFLGNGESCLKPMTRKQIADEIEVHESTVSRAVSNKFVQTPRGVFEIKHFFSGGIKSSGGEEIAALNVKARVVELTAAEDKKRPLSDRIIADILGKEGILISRRTVAKYRLEAGIAPSSRRSKR